jgi:protein O-GlcNAc transferase
MPHHRNKQTSELISQAISEYRAGNYLDAHKLCATIVHNDSTNVVALHLLGVLEAQKNSKQALRLFDRALEISPKNADILADKGKVLTETGQHTDALDCYQKAIAIDPSNWMALHNQGCTLLALKRPAEALAIFDQLIEIMPTFSPAFNNRGVALKELNRHTEAVANYQKAISFNPQDMEGWCNLGDGLFALKRYNEASAAYDKALTLNPDLAEAQVGHGNILAALDRHDDAFAAYDRALALSPRFAEAWLGRGNVLIALKRFEEALATLDKALNLKSDLANAWLCRGNVCFELKRNEESSVAYDRALALKPDAADAWLGRGNIFYAFKRDDDASIAYAKALKLNPDLAEAWLGRGNVFLNQRRYDDSIEAYAKALALKPELTNAWIGRANAFRKLNRFVDAANSYKQLLEVAPDYKFAKGHLLHLEMLVCDWEQFDAHVASITKDIHSGVKSADPFGYQAVANSARDLQRCAEIYAADRYPFTRSPLWCGEQYNNTRIRIGYLSGEFRNHVVAFLTAGLFELHDKKRFEIFAFDNGIDDGSDLRRRIHEAFDTVVDIRRLDDLHAAEIIKKNEIDILINLNGYFGDERTGVFSHRPAPIQVNYLGFTATMGADYMDYILADSYVIPPECRVLYTESVVYLPDTYQINDAKRPTAEPTPTRAELGLPETGFIYCCFNNSFKITPEIYSLWMRLLTDVESSVLWLTANNSTVSANLREESKRLGVKPERIIFAPTLKYSEYLANYRVADLFLDTFPFNAGATASDALWSGLPVLTCSGEPFTARMAGSLLNAVGLNELITHSLEAYEALALKLARNPALLTSIRAKLARNRVTYPLFNTARSTRNIEAAYVSMWERYRRGALPEHFSIDSVS